MKGWQGSIVGIRNIKDLPEKAKNYIYALEDFIGTKVVLIAFQQCKEVLITF